MSYYLKRAPRGKIQDRKRHQRADYSKNVCGSLCKTDPARRVRTAEVLPRDTHKGQGDQRDKNEVGRVREREI